MSAISNLYDFETQMETAFSAAFTDAGLEWLTPTTNAELQKDRPRCELVFHTGAANQSYHMVSTEQRNASWRGELHVTIIANTQEGGSTAALREYRAQVRCLMATMRNRINGNRPSTLAPYLAYHKIQNIIEEGSTTEYKPQEGFEQTSIVFRVDFGIDHAAWQELITDQSQ